MWSHALSDFSFRLYLPVLPLCISNISYIVIAGIVGQHFILITKNIKKQNVFCSLVQFKVKGRIMRYATTLHCRCFLIALSALIENDRMLIMNAANNCVASSPQRRVPSINTPCTLYVRKPFAFIVLDAPLPDGTTPAHIRIYLIFLAARIFGLHFAANSMNLSLFNFYSASICRALY